MKKSSIFALTFAFLSLVGGGLCLTACGDPPQPKEYDITVEESSDYVVTIPQTAKKGEFVDVEVDIINQEVVFENVYYNGTPCDTMAYSYYFIMPAEDVTITVETSPREEVYSTSFVWLDSDATFEIATDGEFTFSDTRDFLVHFNASYMTILYSDIISTNQAVIPNNAIDVEEITSMDLVGSSGSNQILQAKIKIDPTLISPGRTMIIAEFENGNSSGEGTLVFYVNVVEYGQIEIQTMKETLVFDLSSLDNLAEKYTIRVGDSSFVDGGNLPQVKDYVLQPVDGKLTLEIDYAIGHEFWLRISEGEVDNYKTNLIISEKVLPSGDISTGINGYSEGDLTFKDANLTLELDVIVK